MLLLGNVKTNEIFEAKINEEKQQKPIQPSSTRAEKDQFITDKYVRKKYVLDTEDSERENINQVRMFSWRCGYGCALHIILQEFWVAIKDSNLHTALRCLALGADINYRNPDDNSRTALHIAVLQEDVVAVEFLLQWFCDVDQGDADGWTSLHHAASENNVRFVLTLLRRHAKPDIQNSDGKVSGSPCFFLTPSTND
jgi:Arf-GAP/coiled-coil/ANK repeat/PH domain-containing protein